MPAEYLAHRIEKPGKFKLSDVSPNPPKGIDKEKAKALTAPLGERLEQLLDLLFFASEKSLLIVLQGMDAAGKDGTIRHLLRFSHAQSVSVASFKVPTAEELSHDFLWRVHRQTPGRGETVIFNRSHYEDVGVVRVKKLAPDSVWKKRYATINAFEEGLADGGTIVLKFFLNIDMDEQEKRLRDREADPEDAWKLSVGDWKERAYWDDYQAAYSDAIGKCAAPHAPWMVIPANKKWYRDLVVTQAIVDALEPMAEGWNASLAQVGKLAHAELAAYRTQQAE